MPIITTRDGVPLYVKDWGAGRPVVLLHGWPLSADTFDDLGMAIAAAGMRAIAYDRRGFGRSGQPWSGYDYDTLATDLADVIAASDARGAALVGFSMGGGEVVRYLSTFRDHTVTQAVLIGSVVPCMLKSADNPDGVAQKVFDQMAQGIAADRPTFWAGFFRNFYGAGVSDDVIAWSCQVAMQGSLKATLDCAKAFSSTDFRPDLPAVTVPTFDHPRHGRRHRADRRVEPAGGQGDRRQRIEGVRRRPDGLLASHPDRIREDVLAFLRSA